jgi:hypothetical protein
MQGADRQLFRGLEYISGGALPHLFVTGNDNSSALQGMQSLGGPETLFIALSVILEQDDVSEVRVGR